jgi:CO/xanthine dehydrogenase FAD-binding subunit
VRATAAEHALAGRAVGDEGAVAEAAVLASEASQAVDDPNGSAAYKEQLVRVLVARCFADATTPG